MKITIDIPDMHVKLLSRWASVSRTLTTAESGCIQASNSQEVSDTDREMYGHCADELAELTPALDELHRLARQAIWDINRAKTPGVKTDA